MSHFSSPFKPELTSYGGADAAPVDAAVPMKGGSDEPTVPMKGGNAHLAAPLKGGNAPAIKLGGRKRSAKRSAKRSSKRSAKRSSKRSKSSRRK